MNLNPLKKEDNTDALVKALEDANNVGAMQPGVTPSAAPDSAAIAADPQVVSAGVADQPVADDATQAPADGITTEQQTDDQTTPVADQTPAEEITVPEIDTTTPDTATDTTTSVNFGGSTDLPDGISSDADAHLNSEGSGEGGELDGVKKSALEELRPLIEKLDLEPADKFDKYLMMLRASDDPALIKPAFEAAQGIAGEKEKAQALLDIINEINYITANQQK